jgi:trimethylamine--corrinoid protein Co-methyltransferase
MQAGYETALNLFLTILSGTNYISYAAGGLESSLSVSYEKLIIDNEIIGSISHAVKGVEVTPETVALDIIKEVGWGGNFLTEPHTVRHCRDEIFQAEIADTQTFEAWKEQEIPERGPRRRQSGSFRGINPNH